MAAADAAPGDWRQRHERRLERLAVVAAVLLLAAPLALSLVDRWFGRPQGALVSLAGSAAGVFLAWSRRERAVRAPSWEPWLAAGVVAGAGLPIAIAFAQRVPFAAMLPTMWIPFARALCYSAALVALLLARRSRLLRAAREASATVAAAVLVLVAASCTEHDGGGAGPNPEPFAVHVAGRVERGGTVTLSATRYGAPVAPATITWRLNPADAGVLSGSQLTLGATGPVYVVATAGSQTDSLALDVVAPPAIVFDQVLDDNRDVWTVALDGGDLRRLTSDAADDRMPTAAGGTVVFTSWRNGNADLYAIPYSGGDALRLTTGTANEIEPALSAEGDALAFTSDAEGVFKLYTAQPDASGAVWRTADFGFPGSVDAHPDWAPDAGSLVFVSTASGAATLYRLTLESGAIAALSAGAPPNVDPVLSPDGRHVAFASDRDGDTELYVLTLASGAVTRLTTRAGIDAQPAWLPDGRIVYLAYAGTTPVLRWLDPIGPADVHDIPINGTLPEHPAAVR